MMDFDRRTFLQLLPCAMALPAAASGVTAASAYPEARKHQTGALAAKPRNVVLLVCDDLGFGDLSCYGSAIKTPNIDRLAASGVRCTHYNAAHPICSASRAALLTGRYAQRSHTAGAYFPHAKSGMSLEETTLANLFQDSGFQTKAIGKWHLGDGPDYLPTNRGFDSYFGVPYSVDMQPLLLLRDKTVLDQDTDRNELTPRYTAEALDFLAHSDAKPFFLYLAYSYPHDPARASKRFQGASGLGDFGDAVAEIDWSVGEIAKALDRNGLLSDTLILFSSDHGPWFLGSPGLLRGRKSSTYEGGLRVPLVAHWPTGLRPRAVEEQWFSNLDIVPTLTSLCGLRPSLKPLDGMDISTALLSGNPLPERKAILYFSPSGARGVTLHCARKDSWKLRIGQHDGEIYINDYTDGSLNYLLPRPELYNLSQDPMESYDLAASHPEKVREILDDLQAQISGFPDEVVIAFAALKDNVARVTTPPGAAPRPNTTTPLSATAWQPDDRRKYNAYLR